MDTSNQPLQSQSMNTLVYPMLLFRMKGLISLVLFAMSSNAQLTDKYVCQDCVKMMDTVMGYISDKPLPTQLVSPLEAEVCGRFGLSFMKDCNELVEGFVPSLMYYLNREIPQQQVCEVLSLCPQSSTLTITLEFMKWMIKEAYPEGVLPSAECQYCQLAEGEVSMLLQNEQAKNIVMQYLSEICDELPFNSVECHNLLTLYIDQVFHLVLGYLSNNDVCIDFDLCPQADLIVE
eukprot:TRINITY_DN282_c0_g1_i2.p2 TRINITY_DN282_c0_g1~~TRINITY_DN282_c0_g1_i2.p2  ORF type:complete len:234 (-),score=35.14 TRINITY_DN282_c0_g1_i2:1021-1722(-)